MSGPRAVWTVLLALAPCAAAAYDGGHLYSGYAYGTGPGYPLSLPQTLRGTVMVPLRATPDAPADTLAALYRALAACWSAPQALDRVHGIEITLDALRDCTPARITAGLGRAIAGRPVALRFVYRPAV